MAKEVLQIPDPDLGIDCSITGAVPEHVRMDQVDLEADMGTARCHAAELLAEAFAIDLNSEARFIVKTRFDHLD